ncbi:Uncharacterized conserved protein YndB, AHSA1/START domain [Devosia enhydra]|uniref:Uncharacterized conserved protein YndB, AHSA1/START domain n=1 Tax=Devosia enhydra TaxID=665118 RepID=A0A1K2I0K6_9HYPH|nr:SRPBCC domain-containing protein [Devosia enhydra]SFZ85815.1 Uncharacterized conserved protein YndB, AHSA1/START domain [Devosia enhydra]
MSALTATPDGDRAIIIRRSFNAPPQLIYDCWTVPALLRRWLLGPPGWTMPVCTVDARIGGTYRYEWRKEESGATMGLTGTFTALERPYRLASSELFDEDWTGGPALVEIALEPVAGGTEMIQTITYASGKAREGALFSGMTEGMEAGFQRLDAIAAETPA